MGKAVIGAVTMAIIGAVALYIWSTVAAARQDQLQHQIDGLNQQISHLQNENIALKADLAKVQSEEQKLAAQNDELRKAIASVKATGQLPPDLPDLTYPPK